MISSFWLRAFPQVRRNEAERFGFFLLLSLLLNLAQTVGLITSETLFLAHYGPAQLPLSFIVAAVATVVGSLGYALGVNSAKNDRYFIWLLAIQAALVLLGRLGLTWSWPAVEFGLVCLFFLSQCIMTNHYWTFTGDFFDTLGAKRLFPLFVVGASLGGALGGLLLSLVGPLIGAANQLYLWCLFTLAALLLLRRYRRRLRRWGPLELEEADETSLSEMVNAANYLRYSHLGRQLVVSCACMILAAFLGQYLYSSIILQAYPEPEALSSFLSLLVLVTNGLEVVVEMYFTPWLIRSVGVANANQVHSALTCGSFLALCLMPNLATAVLLRATRESLENAVASPIRSLVYNALPARSRGRVRAFLEGLVTYAAMALAGAILWAVGSQSRPAGWMYGLGLSVAALYLLANWSVRSSYLKTMIAEVSAGRLDLDELTLGISGASGQRFYQLWSDLTRDPPEHPDPALLRLAQGLSQRQNWSPLMEAARSEATPMWLRVACVQSLNHPGWPRDIRLLEQCATHTEASLRMVALEALGEPRGTLVPDWLTDRLADPAPRVRALACNLLLALPRGEVLQQARQQLLEMLRGEESEVVAAIERTPLHLSSELLQRCDHPSAAVARAALLRLARFTSEEAFRRQHWVEAALRALSRPQAPVRQAALQLLEQHVDRIEESPEFSGTPIWRRIAEHLESPIKSLRDQAASLLTLAPPTALVGLQPLLDSAVLHTSRSVVQCLAQSPRREARELLQATLKRQVFQLWVTTLLIEGAPEPLDRQGTACEYLKLCLENARERSRKLIFDILAGLETPKVIRSVEKVLRFSNLRARADALEVLSNLGDREAAQLLVLYLETGDFHERAQQLPVHLVRQADWREFVASPLAHNDPWLRQALVWMESLEPQQEEQVERILVLRKVPLFAQMSLEQLVAIDQRLEEVEYLPGEVVFEEGQLGAELYILLDGAVRIVKARNTDQELLLTRLEGVNYFGEMAILDDEPRSASVVVEKNSRLLVLKGEQLKDLVEQMPEMAFDIIKVLTARIRQADERLNQMAKNKG